MIRASTLPLDLRRTSLLFATSFCLAGLACAPSVPDPSKPYPLRAGASRQLVPIPVGHPHGGFSQSRVIGEDHPDDDPKSPYAKLFPATRSSESPLTAKAVWLETEASQLAFVKFDLVFTTAEVTTAIVREAKARLGIDLSGKLIVNASHSHAAPGRVSARTIFVDASTWLPEDEQPSLVHGVDTYSQQTVDTYARAAVDAIAEARTTAVPARFAWGTGTTPPDVQTDRRCTNDWLYGPDDFDRTLTVLRLDAEATGAPIAVLFHSAFHPTAFKQTSRALSTDVVGHAEYRLEETFDTPVVAIFVQGAAGGVGHSGLAAGHRGTQAMDRIGVLLANETRRVYDSLQPRRDVVLRSVDRWMPLDRDVLGYTGREFPHEDGALMCFQVGPGIDECRTSPHPVDEVPCGARGLPGKGKYSTLATAALIGDLALLTVPGEPVPEVGKQLDQRARGLGAAKGLVVGYAQDHIGYVLLEEDWLSAGYEPTVSFWGWKFGRYASDQVIDALGGLLGHAPVLEKPIPLPYEAKADAYVPVAATDSESAPAIVTELPTTLERLTQATFAFTGGDPAFGVPEATLEVEEAGGFKPFQRAGWIPVSNLRTADLPTSYTSAPTYRDAPEATVRRHTWSIAFEPPHDLPSGRYRLSVRGTARTGGVATPYELTSGTVEVVPSTALRVEARLVDGALAITLAYPPHEARFHPDDQHASWQLGGFRPLDVRFDPAWTPVLQGVASGEVELRTAGGAVRAAATFETREIVGDPAPRFAPGDGPHFRVTLGDAAPSAFVLAPGTLADRFGNTHGAIEEAVAR